MYFDCEKDRDQEKTNAGEKKFYSLSEKERDVYQKELKQFIKQQVIYAGLDPLKAYFLLMELADAFKKGITLGMDLRSKLTSPISDSEPNPKELLELLELLLKLKDGPTK